MFKTESNAIPSLLPIMLIFGSVQQYVILKILF